MKVSRIGSTFWLVLLVMMLNAQPPTNRYQAAIFNVTETKDIIFSTSVPQPVPGGGFYEFLTGLPLNVREYSTVNRDLKMDVFEPTGDTLSQRPLIIIAFGGGFLNGGKDHWSIRLLCQELAKRGFVTAAIEYRLGMNVFDSDLAMRAVYRGVQDGRTAVRYFKEDAVTSNTYRIDTNHIYIGGHSSGSFIGLHNLYLDKEVERPLSTYQWLQSGNLVADQGVLDGVGGHFGYDGRARGFFNLAGALGFLSYMESTQDPQGISFHSSDDGTVPFNSGGPFSSIIWLVVGADLPIVHGSNKIDLRADTLGLAHEFYNYSSRGHGVHENGTTTLYSDIVPNISNHFFNTHLRPTLNTFEGDTIVCSSNLTRSYRVNFGGAIYYDWVVQGGQIISGGSQSDSVTVVWDQGASVHELTVEAYSSLDAKSLKLTWDVDVMANQVNTFNYTTNEWGDHLNWSLGVVPSGCDDVIFTDLSQPMTILLDNVANISGLDLGTNVELHILPNGKLEVNDKMLGTTQLVLKSQITNQGELIVR